MQKQELKAALLKYIEEQPRALSAISGEIGLSAAAMNDFLNSNRMPQHKTLIRIHKFLTDKKVITNHL